MIELSLAGKTAFITGSSQGIGASIARIFASAGADVVVATRTESAGRAVVDGIVAVGGNAVLQVVDAGHAEQIAEAIAATVARTGRLDIVVHNAASFAGVIAYFRRKGRSHWWTTVVAQLASFVGLAVTVVLAVKNFDLLTGFQNAIVLSLPGLLAVAFVVGGAYAGWLGRNRPSAYAAITQDARA